MYPSRLSELEMRNICQMSNDLQALCVLECLTGVFGKITTIQKMRGVRILQFLARFQEKKTAGIVDLIKSVKCKKIKNKFKSKIRKRPLAIIHQSR